MTRLIGKDTTKERALKKKLNHSNSSRDKTERWNCVLLKERVERLYSFRNGVAKIRLCKCWQLICVQLLGNQKYNCSGALHSKLRFHSCFWILLLSITLEASNYPIVSLMCLFSSFCQQQCSQSLCCITRSKYLPIPTTTKWQYNFAASREICLANWHSLFKINPNSFDRQAN